MLQEEKVIVYAVEFVGNRVTSDDLILREMSIRPGVVITSDLIEKDRLKLLSLGLFNRVEITVASDKGRAIVQVKVSEPFYLYFFPLIRYDVSHPDQSIWGLGGYHRNFRGRAERLSASVWTGFNRGFNLSHRDPWFSFFGGKVSLSLQAKFEDREFTGLDGAKHRKEELRIGFNLRRRIGDLNWIGGGLQWETQSSEAGFYSFSDGTTDRLLVGHLEYQADSRDYRYYPSSGHLLRTHFEANAIISESHYFFKQNIDARKYISAGKIIFAGRIWGEFSQHELPYYRRSSLSKENIRAGVNFGTGGWTSLAGNAEMRFNILPVRYFSIPDIPYAGPYLLNMPFSVKGVIFYDFGYTGYTENDKVIRTELQGWGTGLQFQLPYVETAHILTGWRPKTNFKNPRILIGAGVTF